jgi:hypothetical protein
MGQDRTDVEEICEPSFQEAPPPPPPPASSCCNVFQGNTVAKGIAFVRQNLFWSLVL